MRLRGQDHYGQHGIHDGADLRECGAVVFLRLDGVYVAVRDAQSRGAVGSARVRGLLLGGRASIGGGGIVKFLIHYRI